MKIGVYQWRGVPQVSFIDDDFKPRRKFLGYLEEQLQDLEPGGISVTQISCCFESFVQAFDNFVGGRVVVVVPVVVTAYS